MNERPDHADRSVDVLVAVPAHDEAERIGPCLASVAVALAQAQRTGAVATARIAVALHRCTDETGAVVSRSFAGLDRIEGLVVPEPRALSVGAVRTRLIRHASVHPRPLGPGAWVFSTDADTVVPPDWVTGTLGVRRDGPVDLVLGLADLSAWDADDTARATYDAILQAGLTATGHRHAYAANLAIRLATFDEVGGFPPLAHGEEHGLAAAVREAGRSVVSIRSPRVQTSARMPGRADHGLGALLARLTKGVDPA